MLCLWHLYKRSPLRVGSGMQRPESVERRGHSTAAASIDVKVPAHLEPVVKPIENLIATSRLEASARPRAARSLAVGQHDRATRIAVERRDLRAVEVVTVLRAIAEPPDAVWGESTMSRSSVRGDAISGAVWQRAGEVRRSVRRGSGHFMVVPGSRQEAHNLFPDKGLSNPWRTGTKDLWRT